MDQVDISFPIQCYFYFFKLHCLDSMWLSFCFRQSQWLCTNLKKGKFHNSKKVALDTIFNKLFWHRCSTWNMINTLLVRKKSLFLLILFIFSKDESNLTLCLFLRILSIIKTWHVRNGFQIRKLGPKYHFAKIQHLRKWFLPFTMKFSIFFPFEVSSNASTTE